MVPSTDSELMVAARDGDMDAFADLVARNENRLLQFFARFAEDRSEAEDCTQEVFIKLFRSRARYAPAASFRTFLFTIAMNHWIDVYRHKKTRPTERSLDAPIASPYATPEEGTQCLADMVADKAPGPTQELAAAELTDWFRRAIASMSHEHRAVWVLAEEQGLRYSEVSSILGIPVGTVKSRMHAATHRLRDLLRREMHRWES